MHPSMRCRRLDSLSCWPSCAEAPINDAFVFAYSLQRYGGPVVKHYPELAEELAQLLLPVGRLTSLLLLFCLLLGCPFCSHALCRVLGRLHGPRIRSFNLGTSKLRTEPGRTLLGKHYLVPLFHKLCDSLVVTRVPSVCARRIGR